MRLSIPALALLILGSLAIPACDGNEEDESQDKDGGGSAPADGGGDGDLKFPPETGDLNCYYWNETILYPLLSGSSGMRAGWPATPTNNPSDLLMPQGGGPSVTSVEAAEEAGCPAFVQLECEHGTFSLALDAYFIEYVTCCYEIRSNSGLDCNQSYCRLAQESCDEENICCGPFSMCKDGVCTTYVPSDGPGGG